MSHELGLFLFFILCIAVAYILGVDVGRVTERAKWDKQVIREAADRIADEYRRSGWGDAA